jgi:hypothetical protein
VVSLDGPFLGLVVVSSSNHPYTLIGIASYAMSHGPTLVPEYMFITIIDYDSTKLCTVIVEAPLLKAPLL